MANSYFQFKQFRVEQSLAAMKVCTEACLFGALVNFHIPQRILDIGTGTGLLSLMLAQKYSCHIDAVEIDKDAFDQATLNFKNSSWANRLSLYHHSIQEFQNHNSLKYDLVISNPPFFSDHLQSKDAAKNGALHTNFLSQNDLLTAVMSVLSAEGEFNLLLPPAESEKFDLLAMGRQLFLRERIVVYNKQGMPPFRFISKYGFNKTKPHSKEIHIRNKKGEYSEAFIELLKPYYLNL